MARPKKTGLDYFPLDVDIFCDEKISAISGEFGLKGEVVVIRLLCAIYRNGYFLQWNKLTQMKLAKDLNGVSPDLLNEIVDRLVAYEFFDKNLFGSMERILTSIGIQERYFDAIKRRVVSEVDYPYLLQKTPLNRVYVNRNPCSAELMSAENTQSKVKESKVKESKVKESKVVCVERTRTGEDLISDNFKNFLVQSAPSLLLFTEPITGTQQAQIVEMCGGDTTLIKRLLEEMHNNEAYKKKSSAFITFKTYFNNDSQRKKKETEKTLTWEQLQNVVTASNPQTNYERLDNGRWRLKRKQTQ